jgi:hypothetical protein
VISPGIPRQLVDAAKAGSLRCTPARRCCPLGSFEGIPIVTAREAVDRLEARDKN